MSQTETMQLTVNGETRETAKGATINDLLRDLGLAGQACAVEVNRALIPKREHASCQLRESDQVEVVALVGGG